MLEELYRIFKKNDIFKSNTRKSIINIIAMDNVTCPKIYAQKGKITESTFEDYDDTTKLKNILNSDLGKIDSERYKLISDFYRKDSNKEILEKSFKEEINKEIIQNIVVSEYKIRELKKDCLSAKYILANDCERKIPRKIEKQSLPLDFEYILKGSYILEEVIYLLFRYALTRTYPDGYEKSLFLKYLKDSENYHKSIIENLLDGNINKTGVIKYLANHIDESTKSINTVAKFEIATSLLFGNRKKQINNRQEALQMYFDIISENKIMPLANWGIGYILLNYHEDYIKGKFKNYYKYENDEVRYNAVFDYAKKSALYGCGAAFTLLGNLYNITNGRYIKEFENKSRTFYFEISRDLGYYFALNSLGKIMLGSAENAITPLEQIEYKRKAFDYFREAADSVGEPYACNRVGRFLAGEYGNYNGEIDINVAYKYWVKAIENDDTEYYSSWPRYNIVSFFYDKYVSNQLDNEKKEMIESCYAQLYLLKNRDDIKKLDDSCYKELDKKRESFPLNS